jgi:Zn-dependent protease
MFYKVDSVRLSCREYFRLCSIWLLPVLLFWKFFRIRTTLAKAIPDSYEPYQVDRKKLPAEILDQLAPLEEEMSECGFIDPVYHWVSPPTSLARICEVCYRHPSGTSLGEISLVEMRVAKKPTVTTTSTFSTYFRDGSTYSSSNNKKSFLNTPPDCRGQSHPSLSPSELWKIHNEQLCMESLGKTVLTIYSQHEMIDQLYRQRANHFDFQIARGVFVPDEEAEVTTLEPAESNELCESDPQFAAVYTEMNRQMNRKAGWGGILMMLVISAILFFAAEKDDRGWKALGILAAVLVFHELGHLAAMRMFHYRNLRMFFIPFLGAAVTGRNYNVPGWKKAVVSLMGPLPGILLGGILGIVAIVHDSPMLGWAATMFLCLNAFNLLPVLPLDGGHVAHAVIFSRHPAIDAIFRASAAGLLILGGIIGARGLLILGIPMLLSLPMTYRIGKAVHRLRKSGFDAESPDAQKIPIEVAHRIYEEIDPLLPANATMKITAQWTLNAFELLNAKPPGWLASFVLLGVHGLSFLAAIAIFFAMIIAQHGGLKNMFLSRFMPQPAHSITVKQIEKWQGAQATPEIQSDANTIVADFQKPADAKKAFEELTARLPADATATLFGQTLMVASPAKDDHTREKWFHELNGRARKVIVQNQESSIMFLFSITLPDERSAESFVESLKEYTEIPGAMHPIPPWSHEHRLTQEHQKARRTYVAMKDQCTNFADPRYISVNEKLTKAIRRGDVKSVAALRKERRELVKELHKNRFQQLRDEGGIKWDLALIDLYEKSPEPNFADLPNEAVIPEINPENDQAMDERAEEIMRWQVDFGKYLGQLPMQDGVPATGSERFSTFSGLSYNLGSTVYLNLTFESPAIGAPAIVEWLNEKGCGKVGYETNSEVEMDEDDL